MKHLLALVLFFAPLAYADIFVGVGTGVRMKDQSGGSGQALLTPYTFIAGFTWADWSIAAEAAEIRQESGGGNTLVSTRQLDAILWLRRDLSGGFWNPFLGVGGGKQQAQVDTHFAGQVTSGQGEPSSVLGIALGFQSQTPASLNFGFEMRYLSGSQLRTVTVYESVSRLVYQF